jgi:hypothetical protein
MLHAAQEQTWTCGMLLARMPFSAVLEMHLEHPDTLPVLSWK